MLIGLVRTHYFASGNRRTAYLAAMSFLEVNRKTAKVVRDPRVLQGVREGFHTHDEIETGLEGMKSKNSGANDSKFLQIAMRILEKQREFLEKIGRL